MESNAPYKTPSVWNSFTGAATNLLACPTGTPAALNLCRVQRLGIRLEVPLLSVRRRPRRWATANAARVHPSLALHETGCGAKQDTMASVRDRHRADVQHSSTRPATGTGTQVKGKHIRTVVTEKVQKTGRQDSGGYGSRDSRHPQSERVDPASLRPRTG